MKTIEKIKNEIEEILVLNLEYNIIEKDINKVVEKQFKTK